jgi:hypothetical protein
MQSADEASVMSGRDDSLTHLDRSGRPAMVDIGDKAITSRSAEAAVRVEFPPDVAAALRDATHCAWRRAAWSRLQSSLAPRP